MWLILVCVPVLFVSVPAAEVVLTDSGISLVEECLRKSLLLLSHKACEMHNTKVMS